MSDMDEDFEQVPPEPVADPTACIWCSQEQQSTLCYPCGHIALCTACANSCSICPVCDELVEQFKPIRFL